MARKLITVTFDVDEGPGPDKPPGMLAHTWEYALETILEDNMTIPTRIVSVEAKDPE